LWWAVSIWLWTHFDWKLWTTMVAIPAARTYLGVFYLLSHSFWAWGAAKLLVSLALIGTTILSIRKRQRWVVLLTHFVVLLYWFVGFGLIAIGD
jgi:hypothetical protein